MKKTPFIWLGANRARKWPVGEKVRFLDKAASAGLPVPNGAVLLDELFQMLVEAGVVTMRKTAVSHIDPDWLYESLYDGIRFPHLDWPAVIRAAFSTPEKQSIFVSPAAQRPVDLNDPEALAQALAAVWSAPPELRAPFRRDVMVMALVEGKEEGTAVTTAAASVDRITTQKEVRDIPQLSGFFARTDGSLPPAWQRLQKLLRGVRRTFGEGVWQIDWLDDGEICWILNVAK